MAGFLLTFLQHYDKMKATDMVFRSIAKEGGHHGITFSN